MTISSYLVAVRRFFEWAEGMKLYPNVARGIKGARRPRGFRKDPLTVDQVMELLRSVCKDDVIGKRDFALVNLLIRTGIRTVEVVRADVGDIRQNTGETVLWVHGKGRDSKDEFVVLTNNTLKPINDYLRERDGTGNESTPLFISHSNRNLNGRMTTQSVALIVRYYLRKTGVASNRITPHSLRHTAITLSLIAGASVQEARLLGRHSDINTTLTYAHNIDRIARAPERKIDEVLAEIG
jgi:integrase/recombinase XerC/integrase/recombinase XerD